jgi:hypothetical protein
MPSLPPVVYVENLPQKRLAEALLRPYAVEIVDGLTTSGAIAQAEFLLLRQPERPVALLLESRTEDPVEIGQLREPTQRILARASPDNWHVAVAVPRLSDWVLTDPAIRQDFESRHNGRPTYPDLAVRVAEITRKRPFDETALRQQSPDFRGLVEFLQKHQPSARKDLVRS